MLTVRESDDAGKSLAADVSTIRRFLAGLTPGVYEWRVIDGRRPMFYGRTQAMYGLLPDDLDRVATVLAGINGHNAPAVYIVGNPLDPALLGRGRGAFHPAKATAADADVARRRLFYVDVDAERPSGINATHEQVAAAMARTAEAVAWLGDAGFGRPWFHGTSGSGGMLLYRIDLPNDAESAALLAGCLAALAERFPADGIKIDTGVFNAARLFRVPGTVNAKSTTPQPDRPWTLVAGAWNDEGGVQ
jgi:hypothetical protein